MKCFLATSLVLLFSVVSGAEEFPSFTEEVLPILNQYCVGCHTQGEAEAELALDSFENMSRGGEHGPIVDRSHPEKSLLLARITGAKQPAMPPEDEPQPSPTEREVLVRWILGGAIGPQDGDEPRDRLNTPKLPASKLPSPVTAIAFSSRAAAGPLALLGTNIKTNGVDIISKQGLLVPIANGDAKPFMFLLSNTPKRITLGSLRKPVEFDGELKLPITYQGNAPEDDLEIQYGDGAEVKRMQYRIGLQNQMAVARFGRVDLLEPSTREKLAGFTTNGKVNGLCFRHDGQVLVAASGIAGLRGEAILWDMTAAKVLKTFSGHTDTLYAAVLSPDGNLLATASYDRQIMLWNVQTGALLRTLTGHNGAVYDLDFSPDGKLLASASADATVKIWRVSTGERMDTLGQPLKEQYSVDISPDGNYVIAGGEDNRVRMWRLVSRDKPQINPLIHARFAHEGAIQHVRFSVNGEVIVSSSADRTVKIWSAPDLQQLDSFRAQPDSTAALGMPSYAQQVSLGRRDGTVESYSYIIPRSKPKPTPASVVSATISDSPAELTRITESEPNNDHAAAKPISPPAAITGRIHNQDDSSDEDWFRFNAKAGSTWVMEVKAARDDSPLDSHLAVFYEDGKRVPRVQLQAVRDSYFTFRGKDSNTTGDFRLHNWEEMKLNQLLYASGEVVKLFHYPRGPDSGFNVYPNFGSRRGYFDTTPLAHALHEPCYVVEPYPPSATLTDNGLPVFIVHYENDDDSQRRLGKDSRLTFQAPRDGKYLVALRDVRGLQGEDFKYELTIRRPRPSFRGKVLDADLQLAAGTGRKFGVEIERIDGFDGPVDIQVINVPDGLTVVGPGPIEAEHDRAWGMLMAAADAGTPSSEAAAKLKIVASANVGGQRMERELGTLGKIEITQDAKLTVQLTPDHDPTAGPAELPVIEIRPGTTTTATIQINRQGHEGRVGFGNESGAINAPHGVYVDNIGLNGVLIVEGQQQRQFFLTAEPWVQPQERVIFVEADQAGKPTSNPVLLRVLPPGQPESTLQANAVR